MRASGLLPALIRMSDAPRSTASIRIWATSAIRENFLSVCVPQVDQYPGRSRLVALTSTRVRRRAEIERYDGGHCIQVDLEHFLVCRRVHVEHDGKREGEADGDHRSDEVCEAGVGIQV